MGDSANADATDGSDMLNNIYLIIIIAFGVSIAFVVLVIAIYFMSKGRRSRACCSASSARAKSSHLNPANGLTFHTAGSSQIRDQSSPMGFTNTQDYITNVGSVSYVLEKSSPLQCPPTEGMLMQKTSKLHRT